MKIEIKSGRKVYALVLGLSDIEEGTFPVTDPAWPVQILLMKRSAGHIVKKHKHKKIRKTSAQPQEALVVIKGEINASIFTEEGKLLKNQKVKQGQCLLLVDGGHEVKMLKNSLIYAFKDGPHKDDKIFIQN